MSKVIGFIKGNLVIVVSVVLILAFLPTGFVFSQKWNKKVHEEATAAYKKEKRSLDSKSKINYSLPAVLEGEADLSESRAPNTSVTEFYKARKAERELQVQDVVGRGTDFNKGDHVELVEGILPSAVDNRTLVRLAREMAEAVVGTETRPSVYQRKLQRLNAGAPPLSEVLADELKEFQSREKQRYENANTNGEMSEPQEEQLAKAMTNRRLGSYIGQSQALTFYCSTDAFVGNDAGGTGNSGYSQVPAAVPPLSTISEPVVFNWLWDYWMISDVLDAAYLANTNPQTGAMAVPEAPVKRVESIRVSKLDLSASVASGDDNSGGRGSRARGGGTLLADPTQDGDASSFTGRAGGQANSAYDIRTIELVVVASSQDLPKFIDAIGKTNYMTVTDLDLDAVEIWADLDQGFYYGDGHVVRASITIESVWLRSWMTPLMPDQVKTALGVPLEIVDFEDVDG